MATQVELVFVLKKAKTKDRFDTELPVRVPITGEVEFLPRDALELEAANAVMGVRQQGTSSKLAFVRLSEIEDLDFSDTAEMKKLRFRVLITLEHQGEEREAGFSYEIPKDRYTDDAVPGEPLPGTNWLALVTREAGEFQLLLLKELGGTGGGDPCEEMGCVHDVPWPKKVECWMKGCPVI